MLISYDVDDNKYIASNILDKKDYFYKCPACEEDVFLKYGDINAPCFAHYESLNKHEWELESYEHYLMKFDVYDYFKDFSWVKNIEFEKAIFKDNGSFLIPDIYIETNNDVKIAIECQCNIYQPDKINEKTKEYNKLNILVLWIFNNSYTNKFIKINDYHVTTQTKVECSSSFLKNIYFERYYIYNDYKSNYHTWDTEIVNFMNSNLNIIKEEIEKENVVYIDLNDDEKKNSKILNFKLNNYFKAFKVPYVSTLCSNYNGICKYSGNTTLEIKYDKYFDYLKNYDVLFALTNVFFRKSKLYGVNIHYENIKLRTFYDKFLNFGKLKDIILNEKMLFVDKRNLNENYLFKKITDKHEPQHISNWFKDEIELW